VTLDDKFLLSDGGFSRSAACRIRGRRSRGAAL